MKKLIDTFVDENAPIPKPHNFFQHLYEHYSTTNKYWYEMFDWSKDLYDTIVTSSVGDYSYFFKNLDDEYYLNHSGQKPITPLMESILATNGYPRQSGQNGWDKIFLIIYMKYKNKWDRLYALLSAEYNPIENYSMTEKEDIPTQTKKTNTDLSDHFEEQEDAKQENDVYGFNSATPVPSSESKSTKDKLTNYNDRHITGLATNNYEETSYNKKRELTREGNIGVTTSQQMIESEIALWQWNFIQEVIYKDIDELLTQNFYESEI